MPASPPPIPGSRVASVPAPAFAKSASVSSAGSDAYAAGVQYVKIDASSQLDEDFQFGDILGEGAFGQVLLAVRKRDGETFAVKKLAKNRDTRSTYGKSWENEIRVMRRFRHPNIVELEIIYESENNCYLFMELCDGGTLSDELGRRGRFVESDAKCVLRQVGSALGFLHRSRVVHRDLKLQNCLLRTNPAAAGDSGDGGDGGDGGGGGGGPRWQPHSHRRSRGGGLSDACPYAVKLTDFGLSIELRDIDHALADNVGTPMYQAPEIVSGSSYTFKCDVWAFGILAYCLLHGRSPFSGERLGDSADLVEAIKTFDYAAACADCGVCRRLSRECRGCLQRLLLTYQVERWSIAEFMDSAWATDSALGDSADACGGSGGGGGGALELMRSMNKANSSGGGGGGGPAK